MARFDSEIPKELIDQLNSLDENSEKMMREMTDAGAEVVMNNVKSNMRKVFKDTSRLEKCLVKTRSYKTPSDDGINTKVAFYGYFTNAQGKKVPAPLVAQAREYGTASGEAKKPFFRKSFKKKQIESAMKEVQERYIKDE